MAAIDRTTFKKTAIYEQITVKFDDVLSARALMQSIHILSDKRHTGYQLSQPGQRLVAGIGLGRSDQTTSPSIPAPNQCRVVQKGLGRCQVFRAIPRPQAAVGVAKRGYAAFSRYSSPGQNADMACFPQSIEELSGNGSCVSQD